MPMTIKWPWNSPTTLKGHSQGHRKYFWMKTMLTVHTMIIIIWYLPILHRERQRQEGIILLPASQAQAWPSLITETKSPKLVSLIANEVFGCLWVITLKHVWSVQNLIVIWPAHASRPWFRLNPAFGHLRTPPKKVQHCLPTDMPAPPTNMSPSNDMSLQLKHQCPSPPKKRPPDDVPPRCVTPPLPMQQNWSERLMIGPQWPNTDLVVIFNLVLLSNALNGTTLNSTFNIVQKPRQSHSKVKSADGFLASPLFGLDSSPSLAVRLQSDFWLFFVPLQLRTRRNVSAWGNDKLCRVIVHGEVWHFRRMKRKSRTEFRSRTRMAEWLRRWT